MFGYPVLIVKEVYDLKSPCAPQFLFPLRRNIKHSRQCFVKNTPLHCALYFQLSTRCLNISMKRYLSCLICYINAMFTHTSSRCRFTASLIIYNDFSLIVQEQTTFSQLWTSTQSFQEMLFLEHPARSRRVDFIWNSDFFSELMFLP